jgi:hypothetical protein
MRCARTGTIGPTMGLTTHESWGVGACIGGGPRASPSTEVVWTSGRAKPAAKL